MFALVAWVSLASAPAAAAVPWPERVRVDGPACGEPLGDRVARAGRPGAPIDLDVEADARLRPRSDGRWELELEITRGDALEQRHFVADECGTLLDAAAFVIAAAMDPTRTSAPVPTAEPTAPTEPTAPEPAEPHAQAPTPPASASTAASATTSASPPPRPRPPARRRPGAFVGVWGGLDGGALPGATGYFEADIGARGRGWRVGLLGGTRLQTEQRASLDPKAGAKLSLWNVGVRACGVPSWRVLELPLCLGADAGQLRAQGFGYQGARSLTRPWAAIAIAPGLLWRVHPRVAIGVRVELDVPLRRTQLVIEHLEALPRVGPVAGRGLLGLEGRFP
ncbi:MAG: hypothetical protein K1X88_00665 [Nannocystaceae bacterium]|nr:hypothetical protein [Nannocystaceae bacterium]